MCNQAVSLVAAELERRGITTVVLQFLREIAEKVRPPRALWVPYPHGYAFGAPSHPAAQHEVIEQAFRLLENPTLSPPALVDFQPKA